MGTAAGFFGITYQGAVNGLASNTLSIFNMVRPSPSLSSCPSNTDALLPSDVGRHPQRSGMTLGRTIRMTGRG